MASPSLNWSSNPSPTSALSEAQVKSYLDNGFVVVDNLVAPDELEELKREFVKIAKGAYQPSNIVPLPDHFTDEEVRSVL